MLKGFPKQTTYIGIQRCWTLENMWSITINKEHKKLYLVGYLYDHYIYVKLKAKKGLIEDTAAQSDRRELDGLR